MAGRILNRYKDSVAGGISIQRPGPYGNPFRVGIDAATREEAIARFKAEVLPTLDLSPLLGRDLVCTCAPKPCHGDTIIWALYRGL